MTIGASSQESHPFYAWYSLLPNVAEHPSPFMYPHPLVQHHVYAHPGVIRLYVGKGMRITSTMHFHQWKIIRSGRLPRIQSQPHIDSDLEFFLFILVWQLLAAHLLIMPMRCAFIPQLIVFDPTTCCLEFGCADWGLSGKADEDDKE